MKTTENEKRQLHKRIHDLETTNAHLVELIARWLEEYDANRNPPSYVVDDTREAVA